MREFGVVKKLQVVPRTSSNIRKSKGPQVGRRGKITNGNHGGMDRKGPSIRVSGI